MPTCNILDFSLIQEYYSENVSDPNNPKSSATNLCCYESLPMSYDTFVSGISHLYNSSCLRDREFSDYVTQLFTDCLSGSTGGVTKIIAGTNITISPTSGLGDVTINSSGSGGGYWTGNTDGTISNSGLTSSNVGIGTHVPSEMLSVSGNTNITNNLFVSGDTFYEGALSGTGNISTLGTVTTSNVITPVISNATGDQIITLNTLGIDVLGPIDTNNNLYISGNTFYEGALSGTGNITTVGDVYTDQLRRATDNSTTTKINLSSSNIIKLFAGNSSNEVMKLESSDVSLPNTTNFISSGNLYVTGNTFYEGALSGTGNISTTDSLLVSGDTYFGSTVDVGIDGTGHDVIFYSDTDGRYLRWDTSRSALNLNDETRLEIGTSSDFALWHDASTNRIMLQNHPLTITTGNTPGDTVMLINAEQQVGIGTQSGDTTNRLHVSGTSSENPARIETLQNAEGFIVVVDDTGVLYKSEKSSGSVDGLWSGGTHDGKPTIVTSGGTEPNVGIGTDSPTEILTVSGNTNISSNLFVSGDTFYEGALSGTGNITTVNNITAGGSVSARGLTSTQYLNVSGNTFYEGTLSGTGTITTTDTITGLNISMKGAVGDGVVQLLPSEDQSADVQLTIPILSGNDEIVTRTGSETLTNKTLTTPSIAMGTNKITGLGDPTAAQDAVTRNYLTSTTASTYAYQYISFFSAAAGANLDGGNWVLPSAGGGISNHTWNNDSGYAGTNDSPGDGPFNAAQSDTHIAIPVPVDGFLVGFTCNCRNNGSASNPRNAGLFVGTPDWGTTNSTPFYLRAFGAGDDEGGAANSKPYKIDGMLGSGSTVPFAVSKDMQVLPAMCAYDTDNVAAQCTWTVVFKTAVSGTT